MHTLVLIQIFVYDFNKCSYHFGIVMGCCRVLRVIYMSTLHYKKASDYVELLLQLASSRVGIAGQYRFHKK
jgi:hypothetical protein